MLQDFFSTLSAAEQQRAQRFHFQRDRTRFIVAHGILRRLLSRYVGCAPADLAFQDNAYGKPALHDAYGGTRVCFNMSHSYDLAVYAITRGRAVGIDVERLRDGVASQEIAARFFSQQEIATLRALPTAIQQHAFFLCWTRKEAYIKARGQGLSLPLSQFDVSLTPGEPAALLRTREGPEETARWSLFTLEPFIGAVAALAVEKDCHPVLWQWPATD